MLKLVLLATFTLPACGQDGAASPEPMPAPAPKVEAPKPPPPPAPPPPSKLPEGHDLALLDPSKATEKAPDEYKVEFVTSRGNFVVEVHRDWAPLGADRFYNLVKVDYYDGVRFFRAVEGFMVQFGISGYPDVNSAWRQAKIKDDPVKESNTKGRITFATSGKDSRTTQVFINYVDNSKLDGMGFAPFGEVVSGMDIVSSLYTGYGEGQPRGRGPDQGMLQSRGNAYLDAQYPKLDSVTDVRIVE